MHARLHERWTVAKLARVAGMSRAAFARQFQRGLGMPPLRYLTNARLSRAAQRLVTSDATLADIAREVGYLSSFALSRAFRRHAGKPPAVYRRDARSAPTVARLAA
jgi:transcriptional regulator GlxA family with amidase domain